MEDQLWAQLQPWCLSLQWRTCPWADHWWWWWWWWWWYILLRIDYDRHRSFHFGRAVLSTQHFYMIFFFVMVTCFGVTRPSSVFGECWNLLTRLSCRCPIIIIIPRTSLSRKELRKISNPGRSSPHIAVQILKTSTFVCVHSVSLLTSRPVTTSEIVLLCILELVNETSVLLSLN